MLGVADSAGGSNGGRDLCLGIPEKMNVCRFPRKPNGIPE